MPNSLRVVLLLGASREFDRGLLAGITRYANLHGPWNFYREPHGYFMRTGNIKIDELKAWKPDGVICPVRRVDLVRPLRVPIIVLDINEYDGRIPGVVSDDLGAGQLAADHLLKIGLEQFAFCGFEAMRWSRDRCQSFCNRIEACGYDVKVYRQKFRRPMMWSKEEPVVRSWLETLPKPTGLFCANDDRSANILESCRALGFGVPEEIAVIGVDDDPYICELANPPLSSVSMASDRAGYEAAELLERMILCGSSEESVGEKRRRPRPDANVRPLRNRNNKA